MQPSSAGEATTALSVAAGLASTALVETAPDAAASLSSGSFTAALPESAGTLVPDSAHARLTRAARRAQIADRQHSLDVKERVHAATSTTLLDTTPDAAPPSPSSDAAPPVA